MSSLSSSLPSTTSGIRIHEHGPAQVLKWDENVPLNPPGPNEVTLELAYAGVNYIDTYHRTGLYAVQLPYRIGREGAGVIIAKGDQVTNFNIGDRVAFHGATGSYSKHVTISSAVIVSVPSSISLLTASAAMLQGGTAHYLISSTYQVTKETTLLIHAAAGGTGQLLVQLAKSKGAKVIATVGSDEKAKLVKALGADEVINYNNDKEWWTTVRNFTGGQGVHVVYDGVGKATYEGSFKSLRKRGLLVLFGNASGAVPPIDPLALTKYGSVYLTRPTLVDYTVDRAELEWRSKEIFDALLNKSLNINVGLVLDVENAVDAHLKLESRAVSGKIVLKVNDKLQ